MNNPQQEERRWEINKLSDYDIRVIRGPDTEPDPDLVGIPAIRSARVEVMPVSDHEAALQDERRRREEAEEERDRFDKQADELADQAFDAVNERDALLTKLARFEKAAERPSQFDDDANEYVPVQRFLEEKATREEAEGALADFREEAHQFRKNAQARQSTFLNRADSAEKRAERADTEYEELRAAHEAERVRAQCAEAERDAALQRESEQRCGGSGEIVHPPSRFDLEHGESRRLHTACPGCIDCDPPRYTLAEIRGRLLGIADCLAVMKRDRQPNCEEPPTLGFLQGEAHELEKELREIAALDTEEGE